MRLLIDECLPKQLKGWLGEKYPASTVQEMGWANIGNGKLLRLANESGFHIFLTADRNIYHQQNFHGLQISAVVIPSNRKILVRKSVPALIQSLEQIQAGQQVVMDLGSDIENWESLRLHAIAHEAQHIIHVFKPWREEVQS
uniref:Predicted nuclease, contains PIN domain, potential toxin-antitoxin system component n=1 Tax=Candidatus Kentrum sp. LFY TaxID=2126342 RepID=A0A450V3R8_9GAMM|nr:MAG: Predicted nuclease, contains PIN domain, potential toxin-antitoxin system component [Candidatus Kentron sp. LFY]